MEETALATLELKREISPSVWGMIREMAPVMHESRLFGVASVAQATAILIKGYECGFGFASSFDMIQVIQGKPSVSPRGALALIMQSPEITNMEIKRLVDDKGNYVGHSCTMERKSKRTKYTAQFTLEDAARAGLIKDDSGWKKYPENMCLWRAVGFCADVIAPDISSGMTSLMKMPEAYGVALTPEGDIIDLKSSEAIKPAQVAAPALTLNDLVEKFGPEQIMAANSGTIPGTQAEINAVAIKLGGV